MWYKLICLMTGIGVFAQSAQRFYFPEIDQYTTLESFLNPAGHHQHRYQMKVGNHSQITNASNGANLANYYAQAIIGIKKDTQYSFYRHQAGLLVHSEQEGKYLGRTRMYGNYSLGLPLSSQWKLALGMSMGFFNYYVASTPSTGSKSAFAADGSAGVSLWSPLTRVSLSSNHVFNSSVSDFANARLSRLFNAIFIQRIPWTPWISQEISAWYCWRGYDYSYAYTGTSFHWNQVLITGIALRTNLPEIQYQLGITTKERGSNRFKIMGSYSVPLGLKNLIQLNQAEINLIWEFN
jgi:hypothetical protein